MDRVLRAMAAEKLGTQHFASLTGYGHGDQGRELVDRVFARVLGAEAAAVRTNSGSCAISDSLNSRYQLLSSAKRFCVKLVPSTDSRDFTSANRAAS